METKTEKILVVKLDKEECGIISHFIKMNHDPKTGETDPFERSLNKLVEALLTKLNEVEMGE